MVALSCRTSYFEPREIQLTQDEDFKLALLLQEQEQAFLDMSGPTQNVYVDEGGQWA